MNDTKLIQSIKNNDEQAIELLMAKYSKLLWKMANDILRQIGSAADTEEVVADVFIHIWRNPDSFDSGRSSLKNYLCLLCKSKAIDKLRLISRNISLDIDSLAISDYIEADSSIIQKEELSNIYEAIKSLSPEEQSVVIRRLVYNQKPKDISKATGLKVRKIENILHRAKIKIRDYIYKKG